VSRSTEERAQDILDAIEKCERFRTHFDDPDPNQVEMAFEAALRNIAVIGEAANHLPATFTEKYPAIDWAAIVGMRNALVHQYFGVDPTIVTRVLDYRLAPLADAIRSHLKG
jgi:uncharacterized protein with HEPN domain